MDRFTCLAIVFAAAAIVGSRAEADEPPATAEDWMRHFSENWREDRWEQRGRFHAEGYMRAASDEGWQARMRALQGCVRLGEEAIPPLSAQLERGAINERILAAQTLGFLGDRVSTERLVEALAREESPAVRLYLVASLGMLGRTEAVDWDAFTEKEEAADVKRHVAYLREREGKGLDPAVVARLRAWDARHMATAQVEKPAPEFDLPTAQGDRIRLSDFRGRKWVVLVFITGDTCPVCHGHLAQLREHLAEFRKANVELLAVDPHEVWAARALLKETGATVDDLHYPLLLDPAFTVSAAYGVAFQNRIHWEWSNRPATFILDADGVIRYARRAETFSDRPTAQELLAEITKLQSR